MEWYDCLVTHQTPASLINYRLDEKTPMEFPSDQDIKGYKLHNLLGEGQFGAVYQAYQTSVDRQVAVKVIKPEYANQPQFIRRFEAEAQIVAQLEHIHIVPLYDYWREPDHAFLVMRLMRGGSLAEILRAGPLDHLRVANLLDQIASGLSFAHQNHVVHRDIKPANILMDMEGNAFLSDFGIAKFLDDDRGFTTQTGAIVGTPAYISPEQIQGDPVTPQTDIYCLGIVLFEMLTGTQPYAGASAGSLLVMHLNQPLPSVSGVRPDLPGSIDAVLKQATAKTPGDRFSAIVGLAEAFRTTLETETGRLRRPPLLAGEYVTNPYRGLRAFREVDASNFYGRVDLVDRLMNRLSEKDPYHRFLAVVGPSGSGKSSLVNAGLVPALRRGSQPGSEEWYYLGIVPGSHPLEELELSLLRIADDPALQLLARLRTEARGLLQAARLVLPNPESVLFLVIDQFEEVFTLAQSADEKRQFLRLIAIAVKDPRSQVRVLITLRADFYDRPLLYPEFGDLMQNRTEVVIPLSDYELEEAIVRPVEPLGIVFQPLLVPRIINEVHAQPGTLPLLQYALTELFDRREGPLLTQEAYDEIGGVMGALGRRAEEIYLGLTPAEREIARQHFLRLVTLGEGVEDTRRRVLRSELADLRMEIGASASADTGEEAGRTTRSDAVLDAFGVGRLLTFDHDPASRSPTVEVAHEALIRAWVRLRGWLEESRTDIRLQRIFAEAAGEWVDSDREPSFLILGTRLRDFETWTENTTLALSAGEIEFLEACQAQRKAREAAEQERQEREASLERRSQTFLQALLVVFVIATVISALLTIFAFGQRNAATELAALADRNAATATVAQGQAEIDAATAVAAQQQALTAAEAEQAARQAAEQAQRLAASGELVAFTQRELDQPSDPSYSLALLLARESVLVTWLFDRAVSPEAENALRQAIDLAPVLVEALQGHAGSVRFAAWSPDGLRIATSGADDSVRIWDPLNGSELAVLGGHTGDVVTVSWSGDGNRVLTASRDNTVRIWDVANGDELARILMSGGGVTSAFWDPGERRILTADLDGVARIWDAQSGELVVELAGHTAQMTTATWSPDGLRIVTTSSDHTVRIWEAGTGTEILRLEANAGPVNSAWFSHDGNRILSAHDAQVAIVWDAQSGEIIHRLPHGDAVLFARWSPDDVLIAAATSAGASVIWDARTGQEIRRLQAEEHVVWALDWDPTGTRIVTAEEDGAARIWDRRSSAELGELVHSFSVFSASWSPLGDRILTAGSLGLSAFIWDPEAGGLIGSLEGHLSSVQFAVWSPDGARIATASLDGTARVWDADSLEELVSLVGHQGGVNQVAWSPDGALLLTAGRDRTARVWNVENGEELLVLEGHSGSVIAAAWSPASDRIATAGTDATIRIWNIDDSRQMFEATGHDGQVNSVAWSPDGRRILSAGSDRTARVWDALTGRELGRLEGHQGAVWSAAWSPDGSLIATAGGDGDVRIWDAVESIQLSLIHAHEDAVRSVAWDRDGARIITGSSDHTARIWPVGIAGLLELADSLIRRNPPDFTTNERCAYLHDCGG